MSNFIRNHMNRSGATHEPLIGNSENPMFFLTHSQYSVESQSPSLTSNGHLWQQTLIRLVGEQLPVISRSNLNRKESSRSSEQLQRNQDLIQLLRSWREDDEEEQSDTLEYLKQALDEDRLSDRKLFP